MSSLQTPPKRSLNLYNDALMHYPASIETVQDPNLQYSRFSSSSHPQKSNTKIIFHTCLSTTSSSPRTASVTRLYIRLANTSRHLQSIPPLGLRSQSSPAFASPRLHKYKMSPSAVPSSRWSISFPPHNSCALINDLGNLMFGIESSIGVLGLETGR